MAAIHKFNRMLFKVAADKGFWLRPLGELDGYEMWLVRTREIYSFDHQDPRVLIVSGFHGEEVAGPWAILKWITDCDKKWLEKIDLSFIPIVNSYGFARRKRYGSQGIKTNSGFFHNEQTNESPSPEGQVLINHIDFLRPLAQDGFLSLHEDVTTKAYYVYTFEHGTKPGKFTYSLRRELGKYFPKRLDGVAVYADANNGNPLVKNGLVYKLCDGSFEDWLFHLGVPKVAVTETPGKYKLQRRVIAGVGVIQKFLELIEKK